MRLKAIWGLLVTAANAWVDDNAPRLGAALSYYTLFAVSPLFIIVLFIASLWFDRASIQTQLFNELAGLVGKTGAAALQSALKSAVPHSQGVLASAIALGTLLLSATGVFIELQGALNTVWGVEAKSAGVWGFIRSRLLSFAMVVGIGFLLLVSLVVSAALSAATHYLESRIPGLGVLSMIINGLVSFAVITVLFAMVFKVLPDVVIAWRDVWIGAVITALLFTAGKFLIGMYLGRSTTVSAYGAAGSVVLILLWVYYSAQIVFFGAEVTQAYANQFGVRLRPKPNARWISASAAPPVKPTPNEPPGQNPPDNKAQLVADLKKEVESLRALREVALKRREREA